MSSRTIYMNVGIGALSARIAVHCAGGSGPPLLLVHSVNAAASAAEVGPLCARYASTRRVYCVDLPGFGHSDRTDLVYTPRVMTDAIIKVARQVGGMIGKPVDALAVSLGCEFLARAACELPELFRSLALVSPTGFSGRASLRAPPGTTRGKPWVYALLKYPGWSGLLYKLLTRPGVIRYFLERTWGSKFIDEPLWRLDIAMTQYPGARFAPLHFLSGSLFSADIHNVYDALQMPVWVSHGTRGDFVDYRQLPAFVDRKGWTLSVFDAGALIYFEELSEFGMQYDRFLGRAPAGP